MKMNGRLGWIRELRGQEQDMSSLALEYGRDAYRKFFQGGGKLGPHKRMTLAIMIIAYIYTSICLLRFALFA